MAVGSRHFGCDAGRARVWQGTAVAMQGALVCGKIEIFGQHLCIAGCSDI